LSVVEDKDSVKEGKLEYGNAVEFTFKILDEVSKKNVWSGKNDATAYLLLRHDSGKPSAFSSVKHGINEITHQNGKQLYFSVEWSVNPNAFKGPAVLSLVYQDADGTEVPLLKGSQPWGVNVDIGGEIEVTQKGHSAVLGQSDSFSFFVAFDLSCQQKKTERCSTLCVNKAREN